MLAAVRIPDHPDPVPEDVLKHLPTAEAAHARTLKGYRQVQFVGGRIALRAAAAQLGLRTGPLMSNHRGAPILPAGMVGSVSHKRDLAIGMVARANGWTLGVDLEDYEPMRLRIAGHILTVPEMERLEGLSDERRWMGLLLRFSIKESIYKAIDPYVERYVGFHEAIVQTDLEGNAEVSLDLKNSEGPFEVDVRYEWLWGRVLTSARIRPLPVSPEIPDHEVPDGA